MEDIRTSVLISNEFYHLCKIHHIKFSEALRVGISLLLAEMNLKEYDNNLNISRRLLLLNRKFEETAKELAEVKEKMKRGGY